jgi:ABC-type antimicrobial peptide transport system permease subunit
VQTPGALQPVERWLQAEIHRIDPTLPLNISTLNQQVGRLAQRPKFSAVLLGLFAATALVMASVGLYGLMSFFVVQRTHEIGVRMALGATPPNIVRLVLGYAAQWTIAGLLIGLAGAVLAARALQSVLFHVDVKDPWLICLTVMLLMAVALAAAWIPSWRASRVDPLVALRE